VTATSTAQGEDLFQTQRFVLVIADISLPDGTGFDIAKRAEQDGVPALLIPVSSRNFRASADGSYRSRSGSPLETVHTAATISQRCRSGFRD
jgi:CheY-like chemotaxis protein